MPLRLLLDEAWRQARRHWWAIYPAVAVPLALFQVGVAVYTVSWSRRLNPALAGASPDFDSILGLYGEIWGLLGLSFLALGIASSVMGAGAVDAVAGRRVEMGGRWLFVLRPGVALPLLLSGLATIAGTLCCFFPGLVVVCLFGFLVPVLAEEGKTLFAAMGRSVELANRNPRQRFTTSPMVKIFVFLVVGYLLSTAASLVAQLPFSIVQQVMTVREMAGGADPNSILLDNPWQWLAVPAAFFGSLAQSLVLVYVTMGLALLYFDVRNRQEGHDLEIRLEAVMASRSEMA